MLDLYYQCLFLFWKKKCLLFANWKNLSMGWDRLLDNTILNCQIFLFPWGTFSQLKIMLYLSDHLAVSLHILFVMFMIYLWLRMIMLRFLLSELTKAFTIKDVWNLKYFLGIEVTRVLLASDWIREYILNLHSNTNLHEYDSVTFQMAKVLY